MALWELAAELVMEATLPHRRAELEATLPRRRPELGHLRQAVCRREHRPQGGAASKKAPLEPPHRGPR